MKILKCSCRKCFLKGGVSSPEDYSKLTKKIVEMTNYETINNTVHRAENYNER